jgi:hypothetical protein
MDKGTTAGAKLRQKQSWQIAEANLSGDGMMKENGQHNKQNA